MAMKVLNLFPILRFILFKWLDTALINTSVNDSLSIIKDTNVVFRYHFYMKKFSLVRIRRIQLNLFCCCSKYTNPTPRATLTSYSEYQMDTICLSFLIPCDDNICLFSFAGRRLKTIVMKYHELLINVASTISRI